MADTPQTGHPQIPLDMAVSGVTAAMTTGTLDTMDPLAMLQQQLEQLKAANDVLRAQVVALQEQDLASREKIVALQQTELTLRAQLGQTQAQAGREPDDFASAVSHSLDTLQTRLAGLSNPLTDFAVREFSIDAKVAVNVTRLGTVEYRFIQPGEKVDPAAVSNVKMTVVPVPKQTQAGSWGPVEFTPSAGVDEIRGIGRQLRQKLNDEGIYTVGDLLHVGGRIRGTVELASMLEVDRYRVEEWLSHAQLLTIRDVDGRTAGVLYEVGIRTLEQLAASHPETLAAAFNGQVERTGRKRVNEVDAARVTPWIVAARNFLGQQPAPSTDPVPPAPPQPPAA